MKGTLLFLLMLLLIQSLQHTVETDMHDIARLALDPYDMHRYPVVLSLFILLVDLGINLPLPPLEAADQMLSGKTFIE